MNQLAIGHAASARQLRPGRKGYGTLAGYLIVAALILGAWTLREQNLIRADSGTGYWLGIGGTSLMVLLLLYPLRKRARCMQGLGATRIWFRVHMLFGVLGPLLIIIHSNFRLGSPNGRVALFSTLVVAGSGIVGRYLYAKLHYGLYGRRASLESLRGDLEALRQNQGAKFDLVPAMARNLDALENRLLHKQPGLLESFLRAVTIVPETALLRMKLNKLAKRRILEMADTSPVVAENRRRLLRSSRRYIARRLSAARQFAQFRAFETLFSLWHVVHYPLFLILLVAVIVHVIAVHMY